MKPRSVSNGTGNKKTFQFISYTLVFFLLACLLMVIGTLIQNVVPAWHSGVIVGILLFIVMDRLYTYRQLKSLTPLSSEWAIAHGAQWILITLVIRLLLSYANGFDSFVADLLRFARGDLLKFLTPDFVITFLLALLAWGLTAQFVALLDEIGLNVEVAFRDDPGPIQLDAVPAHQRMISLILSLGICLVILATLTRINLSVTFSPSGGIPRIEWNGFSGAEAGALLYFVFGLALLSLSRLMSLQTHWNRLRIPVSSDNLTRQWGMYSLFFLLILAVVVSLLPAGDSLGFFSVVGALFGFLISVFIFLSQLIVFLVLVLFSLPFLFLGKAPPFLNRPAPARNLTFPTQPVLPPDNSTLLALLRSIFLWGSLLAIIVFAFVHYVRQHDSLLAALRNSRITNWLVLAWQWLYRNVEKSRASLTQTIADGWHNIVVRFEGKHLLPRSGFVSVRSLDPRQRIYFFYLAMLRRGGERGIARQPSQTPSEYALQLEKAVPSANEDIDSITQAFVQARYSRQEVNARDAEKVKATWDRIRRVLQSKSKSE